MPNSDPTPYQYPALGKHEIRLLELDVDSELNLAGTLHPATLPGSSESSDDASLSTAFDALSFCWINHDDEVGQHDTICLNGTVSVSITLNLARALRRMISLQKRTSCVRLLWIDQICINQKNDLEKAEQIAMMGDIYNAANVVMIYLGEPTAEEEPFVERVHYYDQKRMSDLEATDPELQNRALIGYHDTLTSPAPSLSPEWEGIDEIHSSRHREFEATGSTMNFIDLSGRPNELTEEMESRFPNVLSHQTRSSDRLPRQFSDFTAFAYGICEIAMRSRWFERVWTFQEAVLAKQPLVMFGALVTHLNVYQQLFRYVQRKGFAIRLDAGNHFAATSRARERRANAKTTDATLSSLLYMTRMRAATEPRDKVFGVLGLTTAPYPALTQPALYAQPLTVIYTEAMISCLEVDDDLALLGATQPTLPSEASEQIDVQQQVPSWVCDWIRPFAEPISKWSENLRKSKPCLQVHAGPGRPRLVLRGIILDHIKSRADQSAGRVMHETLPGSHAYWEHRKTETAQAYSSRGTDRIAELLGPLHQGRNEVNMWDKHPNLSSILKTQEPPFITTPAGRARAVDIMLALQSKTPIQIEALHQMLPAHTIMWQYVAQALAEGGHANDPDHDYRRTTRQEVDEIRMWYGRAHEHPSMEGKACFAAYHAAGICPEWAQKDDLICYFGGAPMLHLIRPVYNTANEGTDGERVDSWTLKDRDVSGFQFVGECWFRDLMNLPLVESWDLVRDSPAAYAELASIFVDIELM